MPGTIVSPEHWHVSAENIGLCAHPTQEAGSSEWYLVCCVDAMTDTTIIGFCIVYASPKALSNALNQCLEGCLRISLQCIIVFTLSGLLDRWCLVQL